MRSGARFAIVAGLTATAWVGLAQAQQPAAMRIKAPEFRQVTEWINSKPLTLAGLKGHVVVLHFWTFG